jgi:hypothetical protein
VDSSTLFIGLFTGTVGFGYFMYGKKQSRVVPMISGAVLMVVPYLIGSNLLLVGVTVLLMALPFLIRE